MSIRELNRQQKEMTCLGCGRRIVTDRCHRFCRVCERRNRRGKYYLPRTAVLRKGGPRGSSGGEVSTGDLAYG